MGGGGLGRADGRAGSRSNSPPSFLPFLSFSFNGHDTFFFFLFRSPDALLSGLFSFAAFFFSSFSKETNERVSELLPLPSLPLFSSSSSLLSSPFTLSLSLSGCILLRRGPSLLSLSHLFLFLHAHFPLPFRRFCALARWKSKTSSGTLSNESTTTLALVGTGSRSPNSTSRKERISRNVRVVVCLSE